MIRASVVALLVLAAAGAPVAGQPVGGQPVAGQSMLKPAPVDTSLPRQKIVTVFGTDPCPKSSDPNEIIICSRRPDEERYRIPPSVRSDVKPPTAIEGNRKILLGDDAGGAGGGIGSCSAVGPGGGTGCQQAIQDTYRGAKKAGEVPKSPF